MEPVQTFISIAAPQGPKSIQVAHELHLRLTTLRSTLSPGAANLLDTVLTLAAKGSGKHRPVKYLEVKMQDVLITSVG